MKRKPTKKQWKSALLKSIKHWEENLMAAVVLSRFRVALVFIGRVMLGALGPTI